MPFMPLVTAAVETFVNRMLWRDDALKAARQPLKGKILRIELKELDSPLILAFSDKQIDVLSQWEDSADCTVATRIAVLPQIRDRQRLTALIKQGDLEVHGDIQVVQHLVSLIHLADFDPAELLAPWIGDIPAEGVSQFLRGGARFLKKRAEHSQRYLADAMTEEWRLAPGRLETVWFIDEVSAIADEVESLEKRMARLEGK